MKTKKRFVIGNGLSAAPPTRGDTRELPCDQIICQMFRALPAGDPERLVQSLAPAFNNKAPYLPLQAEGNDFLDEYPSAPYVRFSGPLAGDGWILVEGYDTIGEPARCYMAIPAGTQKFFLIKAFRKISAIRLGVNPADVTKTIAIGDCDPSDANSPNRVPKLGFRVIYLAIGFSVFGWRRSSPSAMWKEGFHGGWQPGRMHKVASEDYDPRGLWSPYPNVDAFGYPDGTADYLVGFHVYHQYSRMLSRIARRL